MSRLLQTEIGRLQRSLMNMAGLVEHQVLAAVRSLEHRDLAAGRRVRAADDHIDRLEVQIEEDCLQTLAVHHPTGTDLRQVIALLKINHDLEGIADLAVNIADRAIDLCQEEAIAIPFPLTAMANTASTMLKASLDALVNMESAQAKAVCEWDDEVDAIHRQAFVEVERRIRRNPEHTARLIHLLSVARNIERIADLAASIAGDVVYMVEGRIVRHGSLTAAVRQPGVSEV